MALATNADLQTAVGNWLGRPGDSLVTSNVADWITLCEARIAYGSGDPEDADGTFYTRPLRTRAMETPAQILLPNYVSGGTVGGSANAITLTNSTPVTAYANGNGYSFVATSTNTGATTLNVDGLGAVSVVKGSSLSALSGGEIVKGASYNVYDDGTHLILMPGRGMAPLPSGYLSMRNAYIDTSPIQNLDLLTPDEMDSQYPWNDKGTPKAFCIESDSLRFGPPPDEQYVMQCLYYQKFGALSSGANWLMTNKPDVYLWGTLLEAKIFLEDDAGALKFLKLFRAAIQGLQAADSSDRYGGASLMIRSDVTPMMGG